MTNSFKYVGQSTNIKHRFKSHKNKKKSLIDQAIKKYGWKNFQTYIFECCEKDLDWLEIELIKILNTMAPFGYNLESGGSLFKHHNSESKNKMSIRKIGNKNPMKRSAVAKKQSESLKNKFIGNKNWRWKGENVTERTLRKRKQKQRDVFKFIAEHKLRKQKRALLMHI
jgi:group I intron endonuclease